MSIASTPFERETSVLSPELSETQQPLSTSMSVTREHLAQAEQRLVMRAQQGDEKAFGGIVDLYAASMLRTATLIVMDCDIAEDIVQDALIQAWHPLPDLCEAGALRSWLMRIVVNQCLSFKRRLARTTAFVRHALWDQERDMTVQRVERHRGLLGRDSDFAHAIESLPERQRAVIVLHYYHRMTLHEMAHVLQISENTLKKRSQTALNNLRCVQQRLL